MPEQFKLPINYDTTHWSKRKLAREEYVRRQGNNCYYCKETLDKVAPKEITELPIIKAIFPLNFFQSPVHLHHDHDTGMTLGAVHCHCNAVLWQYHGE